MCTLVYTKGHDSIIPLHQIAYIVAIFTQDVCKERAMHGVPGLYICMGSSHTCAIVQFLLSQKKVQQNGLQLRLNPTVAIIVPLINQPKPHNNQWT